MIEVLKKIISLAIIFALAGCSAGDFQPDPRSETIGIVLPSSLINYLFDRTIGDWNWIKDGLHSELEGAGFDSSRIFVKQVSTIDDQIKSLNQLIDQGVDAIVFSGLSSSEAVSFIGIPLPNFPTVIDQTKIPELLSALARAKSEGIILIGWGDETIDFDYDLVIATPNAFDIGKFQAQYLVETLGLDSAITAQTIEAISNSSPPEYAGQYLDGICSILGDYFERNLIHSLTIDCDSKIQQFTIDETNLVLFGSQVRSILEVYLGNPFQAKSATLDAVICASDNIAYESSGILQSELFNFFPKLPEIVGVGAASLAVQNIVDSKQAMTVIYDSSELITDLVDYLVYRFEPDSQLASPTLKIQRGSNQLDGYRFTLIPVTIANLKFELIDSGYLSPGEAGL